MWKRFLTKPKKQPIRNLNPILYVEIDNKKYKLQKSMRSQMMWEQSFNKSLFSLDYANIGEIAYLLYCMLITKNKDFDYSFEDFVDLLDDEKFESNMNELVLSFKKLNELDTDVSNDTVKKN